MNAPKLALLDLHTKNKQLFISVIFCICGVTSSFSQEWMTYNNHNVGLPGDNVSALCVDKNGTVWAGTDKGLAQFNGEIWSFYISELDINFTSNAINDLFFEINGNESFLWVATENGVSLLDITNPDQPSFRTPYNTENSMLISNKVKSVVVDQGNVKWFGTLHGLSGLFLDSWRKYTVENYWIASNKVLSMGTGPDSMVYVATEGEGISRLKQTGVDAVTSASTINTIWAGLDEFEGGTLKSDNIYSILIEKNGCQWFGTDKGIALHTSDNTRRDWINFEKKDGLINDWVQAICQENDSVFWFGTQGGVSRYDGEYWSSYTVDNGLVNNNVRDIKLGRNGSLWFATENGISVLSKPLTQLKITNDIHSDLGITSFPNPFRQNISVVYKLQKETYVKITIYNINGTHVVSSVSSLKSAGEHRFLWNGKNSAGQSVPLGTYMVKISTKNQSNTHKIIMIQ